LNCVQVAGPDATSDLWTSLFYYMRGLFITVGGTAGPQRTAATEGEQVWLQARVYNYSLIDMDDPLLTHPAAKIKVRFYAQPWDTNSYTPIGDSFLIDEVQIDPLPGFGTSASPNWGIARTSWDTTGYGDKDFLFWVVVWMEDGTGNLVPELTGHGLTAIPGTLTSIKNVPIETIDLDVCEQFGGESDITIDKNTCGLETSTTSVSDNVGFFHQVFSVLPATGATAARGPEGTLRLKDVRVNKNTVKQGQPVEVRAEVQSLDGETLSAKVFLFEGEPRAEKVAVDVDQLARIRRGDSHAVHMVYVPRTCGPQELVMVAELGRRREVRGRTSLEVECLAQAAPNRPPQAKLRVTALQPGSGATTVMQLDGTKSSDKDGTLVSYRFAVVDRKSGAVVYGPVTGTTAVVQVPLAAGQYAGRLTVTDNAGATAQTTRNFVVK
jgi:hypothetical protein